MTPDITDSLDKSQLNEFAMDFKELIRVAVGMDKAYGKAMAKLDDYIKRYKALVNLFDKKYNGINAKVVKTADELTLVILLNEKGVKELFANAASKISGLRSIGLKGFDEAGLEDGDKFSARAAAIKNELYLSYYYPGKGADSIYLKFDKKEEKVMLVFNPGIIIDEKSAEFKLCAYYALKDGFKEGIDVYNKAAAFGFVDVLSAKERRAYLDKFEPRMLE